MGWAGKKCIISSSSLIDIILAPASAANSDNLKEIHTQTGHDLIWVVFRKMTRAFLLIHSLLSNLFPFSEKWEKDENSKQFIDDYLHAKEILKTFYTHTSIK